MKIEKTVEFGVISIKLDGKIDISTVCDIEEVIMPEISVLFKELILDFQKVDIIYSCGLRMLLKLQKKMPKGNNIKILNPSKEVVDVFKIAGFDNILDIVNVENN